MYTGLASLLVHLSKQPKALEDARVLMFSYGSGVVLWVARHMLHVTRHTSHIPHHTSPSNPGLAATAYTLAINTSALPFLPAFAADITQRWRVCFDCEPHLCIIRDVCAPFACVPHFCIIYFLIAHPQA